MNLFTAVALSAILFSLSSNVDGRSPNIEPVNGSPYAMPLDNRFIDDYDGDANVGGEVKQLAILFQ